MPQKGPRSVIYVMNKIHYATCITDRLKGHMIYAYVVGPFARPCIRRKRVANFAWCSFQHRGGTAAERSVRQTAAHAHRASHLVSVRLEQNTSPSFCCLLCVLVVVRDVSGG